MTEDHPVIEPVEPDGSAEVAGVSTGSTSEHDDSGLDLARAIARALAGRTGPAPERRTKPKRSRAEEIAYSGAHPDDRDPQTLDANLGRLVAEQGWGTELRVHGVFSRWAAIVGDEVAAHAQPESFADGRLAIRTDSTAWATQMKLLAPDLLRRLNDVLGDGTVEIVDVRGPQAPKWARGRYRVKGRGPRDTYG